MKNLFIAASFFSACFISAQSYAPQAGVAGSTAIISTSPLFKSWATGAAIVRGPQQINGTSGALANAGVDTNATGASNGSVVSLGDGGTATLTFAKPITNGSGFDFAVFENGFNSSVTGKAYLELAFVEVSSDGVNFFRFPSHNEYPSNYIQNAPDQGGSGFATMDAKYLNNFAGKYVSNYGTPFDLSDLPDNVLLDKTKITHVKIIDVVGTNIDGYRTYDSFGNIAIDPFPTPFGSSGFDLDAVGVINEFVAGSILSTAEGQKPEHKVSIYPNPASDVIKINTAEDVAVKIYSVNGTLIKQGKTVNKTFNVSDLSNGNYIIQIDNTVTKYNLKLIISK
ncbi:T9SS type A sorting domain-containing protein [Chryseobacterium sp. SSA4.19]|uniref:T9SS type A sorting domain-containing protein n=1 Tax=Chryseobacterium sp. SSA4.19 TaxID=2919915 RepID=UPI001F4ECB52|nr:T9SS type A sorting domain-containing protein [Chryseobacterium sp. SSA4.19]MCJ8155286.1 T9SS type A sorting domain-containing protein [Chryseobacterium sp. SSA4.19]